MNITNFRTFYLSISNDLKTDWIIPIVTNIIAAIIIFLFWKVVSAGRNLLASGTIQNTVKSIFRNSALIGTIKYVLFCLLPNLLIVLNFWLYFITDTESTIDGYSLKQISFVYFIITAASTSLWSVKLFLKFNRSDFVILEHINRREYHLTPFADLVKNNSPKGYLR